MKSPDYQYTKKRRGLSTIVGALLFVVLMVSTFSVLAIALTTQTEIVETSRAVAATGLKLQQENFIISNIVQPVADDLEVEILNQGQNPTEIFTLVITEVDDPAGVFPTTTYDIPSSTSFLAPGDDIPTDILSNTPIFLDLADPLGVPPTTTLEYKIKVISSLGTIKTLTVICNQFTCNPGGGEPGLDAQLFMDGPNGVNSKTSTIIMFVTNNGEVPLTGVGPLLGLNAGECDNMWQGNIPVPPPDEITDVNPCDLDSPTPVNLVPGQSAFFKWDGSIFGDVDDEAIFCNQARGFDPIGNTEDSGIVCDDLTVINPNDCGGAACFGGGDPGVTIILIDDLLTRPSLFMVIPSPFGEDITNSDDKGVWGVNLVNPTEVDMTVSKLTIVSYPPTSNDKDVIFPKGCKIEMINPTADWSCPKFQTILWENSAVPILLPARSAVEFLVKVEPGDPTGNTDIPALIVQANVFTTLGSFGKGEGYQATMRDGTTAIVNVFLTTTPEDRTDFHGVQNSGLKEDEEATFMISLADMDNTDLTYISAGTKLIINVPRLWTVDPEFGITDFTGFDNCVICSPEDDRISVLGDGSTQLTLLTAHDIGAPDVVSPGGPYDKDVITVTFKATPPCNEIVGEKRPYIMYVLADGTSNNGGVDFPIGPLNEIALIVAPDLVTPCVP